MVPPPIALGLMLCEKILVEEGTKNVTLVNTFTTIRVESFPSPPQHFAVYVALTSGQGQATMELTATRLDTDEEVYSYQNTVLFPDRLAEVRVLVRVNGCSFPSAGKYQLTLLIDGEWIAHRHLHVTEKETPS